MATITVSLANVLSELNPKEGINTFRAEGRYVYVPAGAPAIDVYFRPVFQKRKNTVTNVPVDRNAPNAIQGELIDLKLIRCYDFGEEFQSFVVSTTVAGTSITLLITKIPQPTFVQSV